jgi:hypothetical protein
MESNPFVDFKMPEEAPFASAQVAPEVELLIEEQWRPGNWRGFEMLTCVICQWDTLEGIEAARAKKAGCPRCAPPPPPAPPSEVIVADKWGNVTTDSSD